LTLAKLDRLSEAIESYDKALELDPTVEKIWSNKGLALSKMKQTDNSIDLQKLASTLQKEKVIPELEIPETINIIERQEEFQAPMKIFSEESKVPYPVITENIPEKPSSQKMDPVLEPLKPDSENYVNMGKSKEYLIKGNAFFKEKKYAEAIDFFDISLQLEPENSISWNNKGLALARVGKYDEALICYEKALEIYPNDFLFLNNKGNALYKYGDIKRALKTFGVAFEKNPENMTSIKGMELCIKSLKKTMK
jgi:tetratricopeptide (TPR) repeat protein